MPSSIQYIQVRALSGVGVSTTTPSQALPGVPTVNEFVPGYEFERVLRHRRAQPHACRALSRRSIGRSTRLSPILT